MRLVADANVLLAAIAGGAAKRVFDHPDVEEVFSAESVLEEVREYMGTLAEKKGLDAALLYLTLASLPITVVDETHYESHRPEARRRIAERDPDDVELLALALHIEAPVWSNDSDFKVADIEWYTTAQLLKKLDT